MKISQLKQLVKECYNEVLKEYTTQTPTFDQQSGDFTNTMKISKNDPQKQQKIKAAQNAKQSYELYEDEKVNEMARVPILYSLGSNAEKAEGKLANHPKVLKIIDFIKQNGPSSINTIAKENSWRQQQINPMIGPLVDAGILNSEGVAWDAKNPTKVKTDASPQFNDSGEEIYNDNDTDFYRDPESWVVGFADKYEKKPWVYRDEDGENIPNIDSERFEDDLDQAEEEFDEFKPKDGEYDDIRGDEFNDDEEEEDFDDEIFESINIFKKRAGI